MELNSCPFKPYIVFITIQTPDPDPYHGSFSDPDQKKNNNGGAPINSTS